MNQAQKEYYFHLASTYPNRRYAERYKKLVESPGYWAKKPINEPKRDDDAQAIRIIFELLERRKVLSEGVARHSSHLLKNLHPMTFRAIFKSMGEMEGVRLFLNKRKSFSLRWER